jgi:hypothetical protein
MENARLPVRLKSPAGIMNMHRITVAIAAQKPSHATHNIVTSDFITQLSFYRCLSRKFVQIKINCFCFLTFTEDLNISDNNTISYKQCKRKREKK